MLTNKRNREPATIMLDKALKAVAQELAASHGQSLSEVINVALRQYLDLQEVARELQEEDGE